MKMTHFLCIPANLKNYFLPIYIYTDSPKRQLDEALIFQIVSTDTSKMLLIVLCFSYFINDDTFHWGRNKCLTFFICSLIQVQKV